jgi:hypothetical protein
VTTDQITERILVPGDDDTVQDMIYQALGAASVCWDKDGVFMDALAKQIGEELGDIFIEQISPLLEQLEVAWGIIANASDWINHDADVKGTTQWIEAAIRWRDKYHATIDEYRTPEPEPEPAPVVKVAEDTLVIETTRKGKYVRSYGPFTYAEAGEFALSKIELQTLSGGRHEFVLDSLPEVPWATLVPPPEQPTLTLDEFLSWLDDAVASTEPAQWSTADLDQRDRFPNRPLTADDVAFPNDPWPTSARHRKPWAGN